MARKAKDRPRRKPTEAHRKAYGYGARDYTQSKDDVKLKEEEEQPRRLRSASMAHATSEAKAAENTKHAEHRKGN